MYSNSPTGSYQWSAKFSMQTPISSISSNDPVKKILQTQMEELQTKLVDTNAHLGDVKQNQYEIRQNQQEQNYR
jgi:hypothetical protein